MIYTDTYKSPIGNLLIASKDNKLVGLCRRHSGKRSSGRNSERRNSRNTKS